VTPWSGKLSAPPPPGALRPVAPIIRIAPIQPSPPPLPSSRWITGFPKSADSAASLPLHEKIKPRLIADCIVLCNQPVAYPIVKITAVGHAEAREPFAKAVSLKRANSVLEELQNEIHNSFLEEWNWATSYSVNLPSPNTTIQFQTRFFGSIANTRTVLSPEGSWRL
jgi:hypothetical protein